MLVLRNLRSAERFVTEQAAAGNDVRWVGFDKIVFFRPSEKGLTSRQGAFRNGQWGFDNVAEVTAEGTWEIDYRNVKKVRSNNNRNVGKSRD